MLQWARFLRDQRRITEAEEAFEAVLAASSSLSDSLGRKISVGTKSGLTDEIQKMAREELEEMRARSRG